MTAPVIVLVVEDEPLIRMEIAEELAERGFVVLEAANAREAIDLLGARPEIQILFTDVDMPGDMDGLMLAAAVRHRWPPIKIIVTSGHRSLSVRDLPPDSRFIGKPHDPNVVASAMREMMAA